MSPTAENNLAAMHLMMRAMDLAKNRQAAIAMEMPLVDDPSVVYLTEEGKYLTANDVLTSPGCRLSAEELGEIKKAAKMLGTEITEADLARAMLLSDHEQKRGKK